MLQTIAGGLRSINQSHQILKLWRESFDCTAGSIQLPVIPGSSDSANASHASQEPIPSQLLVDGEQHFFQPARVRIRDDKSDICCDRPDIGNMITYPLELKQNRAHEQST
jgi:hypothetical protein